MSTHASTSTPYMVEPNKLHIAMFPWLAFGHMIPFLELAKLIAQKDHKISFISTPKNIDRLPKIPPNLAPFINLIGLPLPHEDNLPLNAEATTDLPNHKVPYLKKAFDGLQEPLAQFLQASTPDWVIYDFAPHWLPPIAANLGISQATFIIFNASSTTFFGSSSSAMINGDDYRTNPEHFTVPPKWVPFPSNVVFRLHEAKRLSEHFENNISCVTDRFRMGSVISGCEVIAIRSCKELEANWLSLLGELHGKPIAPIGLLPPSTHVNEDTVDDTWHTIREWLDKQNKGSVVYIALGSELTLSQEDITELAMGLELSELSFFWVLKKHNSTLETDSIDLPDGFEERVKGRGFIWRSWAPQLKILGHKSVGVFLTHCGWSSVIEALGFGLVLIMLPFAIDTGLIARVFQEKNVGIEIPRNEIDGSFTRISVAESLRLVMVDEKGNTYRDNALEAKKLFGDKKLHDQYVDAFVEYLHKRSRH